MLNFLLRGPEQVEAERQEWIAHELHDGACQYMAAAQMTLDAFRRENAAAWSGDWTSFEMGEKFLHHAVEELRRLVQGLRPIQLAAGDLPRAIESLIEEIRAAGGPEVELCQDVQAEFIPPRLELAAFRIVQEALANACRHSKSERILVGLTQDDDTLFIQVQDWGVGFDLDETLSDHFGLEGIRRRVELLKGAVTIHSRRGEGTLITVELPSSQ